MRAGLRTSGAREKENPNGRLPELGPDGAVSPGQLAGTESVGETKLLENSLLQERALVLVEVRSARLRGVDGGEEAELLGSFPLHRQRVRREFG